MPRGFHGLMWAGLCCACSQGTSGQAIDVVVKVDGDAVASCVRVEATSNGVNFATQGMLRKDTLSVGVAGGALGNPVTLIARGSLGNGCEEPQRLNLESAVVETTFQADKVRRVTLELHAPGRDTDRDLDGHRDRELGGPDCESGRAEIHPGQIELCANGLDDDCDLLIDCAQPSCANRGPPERCDGKDNDCDGVTDDGFSLGYLCSEGIAACARVGQTICAVDGASSVCSASPDPTQARVETCNGIDDDCDGIADNGFGLAAPCQVGLGVCSRSGTVVCTDAGGGGCSVMPSPSSASREICDGLDNDCDGRVDSPPACGGPSDDVTEQTSSWAVAESVSDFVEPCSDVMRGLVRADIDLTPPWTLVGLQAIRVSYGPNGPNYFGAHYPVTRDAGWDLSTSAGLALAVAGSLPPSYGGWSPAGPTIVLCGRDGGYLRLDPLVSMLTTDGGIVRLQVPLGGDGGWVATRVGGFDLRTVDSLEVHADPVRGAGVGTCSVWLDDVHFY